MIPDEAVEACRHRELAFHSGGHYIQCNQCRAWWTASRHAHTPHETTDFNRASPAITGGETRVAALPAQPEGWRPIESAPKDGTAFLGMNCRADMCRVAYFDDKAKGPYIWHVEDAAAGFNRHRDFLTHWMPLPNRPAVTAVIAD